MHFAHLCSRIFAHSSPTFGFIQFPGFTFPLALHIWKRWKHPWEEVNSNNKQIPSFANIFFPYFDMQTKKQADKIQVEKVQFPFTCQNFSKLTITFWYRVYKNLFPAVELYMISLILYKKPPVALLTSQFNPIFYNKSFSI